MVQIIHSTNIYKRHVHWSGCLEYRNNYDMIPALQSLQFVNYVLWG